MSRVLKNELQILRENLMTCFRETLPSKQFSALLSLSIIWLDVLADREEKPKTQKKGGVLKMNLMKEKDH